jgi:hypothetical protein
MGYEIHAALNRLKNEVGNINDYVRTQMGYRSDYDLADALSAEQVDAVALAIYNIEKRNEAMIIGDQTGIGKGRIAASLIRTYARKGKKPVFITEKPNLFSDMYRDLTAIGSPDLVPFIVNGKESKTQVKDDDGNVIYEAPEKAIQEDIFKNGDVPDNYDYVMATYSQFASNKPTVKQSFLSAIAADNVLILDESHNAGGNVETSATARLFYDVVKSTEGVLFLSATFAKRPDNMPLYAAKTCMNETAMTNEALVAAITKGGVALQEVLSASLVNEGQMIRRERSFEGVEVNYITLNKEGKDAYNVADLEKQHRTTADKITDVLRDIIAYEDKYIKKAVEAMDSEIKAEMKEVEKRKGTSELGVSSTPYFSKLFMVINQMLFAIKSEAVAERAIQRLLEGKKPVIAFSSTMGSFLEGMENEHGDPVSDGDTLNADFSEVLMKGLDSLFLISEVAANGDREKKRIEVSQLSEEAQADYQALSNKIRQISTGISISPIDNIKFLIEQAGYSVAEVTGRRLELQFQKKGSLFAMVKNRKRENVSDAFRKFNNNQVDVLLINQSGSTGASAHAIVTPRVPLEKVKQRVMIVLQAELDINREVQKRGRINRTGQMYKPIYDYVNSAIPAELRLMMMLQRKLKSLDANTTSNQKQSKTLLESPDFLNKYGDKVVVTWLTENPELNRVLGDPAGIESENKDVTDEDMALKVSGRVAILPCAGQQSFYDAVFEAYNARVNYAKQSGEYDLEVEDMNLLAETLEKDTVIYGKGGRSDFGGDTFLEKVEANVLRKPLTQAEVKKMIDTALDGKTPEALKKEQTDNMRAFIMGRFEREKKKIEEYIAEKIGKIRTEKGYAKAGNKDEYYKDRLKDYKESQAERIENLQKKLNNEFQYITSFFGSTLVGQSLQYQIETPDGNVNVPAVFTGYTITPTKPNPYAPSAITAGIAVSDSNRYIELVLSGEQGNKLKAILFNSQRRTGVPVIDQWEELTRKSNVNRNIRRIYTGNLLQAYNVATGGKLISYTCKNGETKKGILMPEHWKADEGQTTTRRSVPLKFCRKAITGLSRGAVLNTDVDVSFMMQYNGNIRIVTKSLSMEKFGWLIKNNRLLSFIEEQGGFQKTGSTWVGSINPDYIDEVIDLMYAKSGCNAQLSASQVELIQQDIVREEVKQKQQFDLEEITKQHPENIHVVRIDNDKEKRLRIAKAKAQAKLKILNLLKL